MELDWSTIVLEIINFLVLIWILTRFLYRPVLDVIAKRRTAIEDAIARAEQTSAQAQSLKDQYESRIAEWEHERGVARDALRAELEGERNRLMAEIRANVAQEREKAQRADERRLAEALKRNEEVAIAASTRFAAKLLKSLAGPELDQRLAVMTIAGLSQLNAESQEALRRGATEAREASVTSAQPLNIDTREKIQDVLHKLFGEQLRCNHSEDASLIAGLRITVGAWVFSANIRDELRGFAELANEPTTA